MKSSVVKRSIVIDGHKTSVSLEDAFWSSLKNIARTEGVPVSKMVTDIDKMRERGNLSCAIRLFILEQWRSFTKLCCKSHLRRFILQFRVEAAWRRLAGTDE